MSALTIAKLIYDLIPEKAKETVTERFTNSAIDKAKELWEKLWGKAQGDAKAEKTLKAVEAGDKDKLDRLKIFLEDLMEDNPEFAEELQKLVQEIEAGKKNEQGSINQTIGDIRDNAKPTIINKLEGENIHIGDNHTHNT